MTVAILIIVVAVSCALLSFRHILRKEWWPALLLALPVMLVIFGVTAEVLTGRAIREARRKAIERGAIEAEGEIRK